MLPVAVRQRETQLRRKSRVRRGLRPIRSALRIADLRRLILPRNAGQNGVNHAWLCDPSDALHAPLALRAFKYIDSECLEEQFRPGPWSTLTADGGGLEIVGRHETQVMIRPDAACGGACTTCPNGPSGLTGTLVAIEGILKAEVDSEIVVIPV